MDSNSNLYGTTTEGGEYGYGTVFECVFASGTYTCGTIYSFTGGNDGANPYAGVILYQGNLYGTAVNSGAYGNGTVFALSPPSGTTVPAVARKEPR